MIKETITFIKATRDEAIALAHDIGGDTEVHALYIMRGFTPADKPVGYLVKQLAKEQK